MFVSKAKRLLYAGLASLIIFIIFIPFGATNDEQCYGKVTKVRGEPFTMSCSREIMDPVDFLGDPLNQSWTLFLLRTLDVSMVPEVMVEMKLSLEGNYRVNLRGGWVYGMNFFDFLFAKKNNTECRDSGYYACMLYTSNHTEVKVRNKCTVHLIVTEKPTVTSLMLMTGFQQTGKFFKYYNVLLCTAEAGLNTEIIWFSFCFIPGAKDAVQAEIKTIKTTSEIPRGVSTKCELTYFTSTFTDLYPDMSKVCNITCCVHNNLNNTDFTPDSSSCRSKQLQEMKLSTAILKSHSKFGWPDILLIAVFGMFGVCGVFIVIFSFRNQDSKSKERYKLWRAKVDYINYTKFNKMMKEVNRMRLKRPRHTADQRQSPTEGFAIEL